MTEHVLINEVGLRDGLQNQPQHLTTDEKLRLFRTLAATGLRRFEITSFVSPKVVPQLADAAEIVQALPRGSDFHLTCLVPNMRGYERAKAAGAASIAVVLSTTDTLNRKNINMTLYEATEVSAQVVRKAKDDGLFARAYIAAALACPFEGATAPLTVHRLAARMADAGADELAIADTIGAGNPRDVKELFTGLGEYYPVERLAAHFHDTRGLGSALAWAALEAGVRRFDSSIAGLGGCPFAPGASGNLATEDIVFLAHQLGFTTGVDFDALIEAGELAKTLVGNAASARIVPWYRSQQRRAAKTTESKVAWADD